jgi:hypothetical protein
MSDSENDGAFIKSANQTLDFANVDVKVGALATLWSATTRTCTAAIMNVPGNRHTDRLVGLKGEEDEEEQPLPARVRVRVRVNVENPKIHLLYRLCPQA